MGNWRRGSVPFRLTSAVQDAGIRRAEGLVVLTHAVRRVLFAPDDPRVEVIPCCADIEAVEAARPRRDEMRAALGLEDRTVLLYVGKLGGWYLQREMVEFYVRAKRQIPDLHLLVLTQSDRALIDSELEALGVAASDCTVRSAPAPEVPAYLAAADAALAFIRPTYSKISSSPTKIGEYLAAGLPGRDRPRRRGRRCGPRALRHRRRARRLRARGARARCGRARVGNRRRRARRSVPVTVHARSCLCETSVSRRTRGSTRASPCVRRKHEQADTLRRMPEPRARRRLVHVLDGDFASGYFPDLARFADGERYQVVFTSLHRLAEDRAELLTVPGVSTYVALDEAPRGHTSGTGHLGRGGWALATELQLARFVSRLRPDIVHAHLYEPALLGTFAAAVRDTRARIVGRHHSDLLHRGGRRLHVRADQLATKLSHAVITNSEFTRSVMMEREAAPPGQGPCCLLRARHRATYAADPAELASSLRRRTTSLRRPARDTRPSAP